LNSSPDESRNQIAYGAIVRAVSTSNTPGASAVNPWLPLAVGVYLLVAGLAAVAMLLDAWTKQFTVLRVFFPLLDGGVDIRTLQTVTYLTAGTFLGAVVISFRGLHEHAVLRGDFRPTFMGSYLLGPWASGFLGIAMYGLIRGGLFLLGGGVTTDGGEVTDFSYLGIGFLIGFAWNRVLVKLDSLAAEMFRAGRDRAPGLPPEQSGSHQAAATSVPSDLDNKASSEGGK
jgi:hypothetical protein